MISGATPAHLLEINISAEPFNLLTFPVGTFSFNNVNPDMERVMLLLTQVGYVDLVDVRVGILTCKTQKVMTLHVSRARLIIESGNRFQ